MVMDRSGSAIESLDALNFGRALPHAGKLHFDIRYRCNLFERAAAVRPLSIVAEPRHHHLERRIVIRARILIRRKQTSLDVVKQVYAAVSCEKIFKEYIPHNCCVWMLSLRRHNGNSNPNALLILRPFRVAETVFVSELTQLKWVVKILVPRERLKIPVIRVDCFVLLNGPVLLF